MRAVSIALIFAVLSPSASAQEKRMADVRLDDGSTVRVTMQQSSVEIMTKYGKLSVPVADIRRIDFGLHVPADKAKEIEANVKRLGSIVHREREAATKALVGDGRFAVHALRTAMWSPDKEVKDRASQCLRLIEESITAELFAVPHDDVIHTADFPIRGRIVAESMQVASTHFGEVSLKLSGIRSVQVRNNAHRADLIIDGMKYGNSLDLWMDTGAVVDKANRLHITADGQVDLWPQAPTQYLASPKGYNTAGRGGQFMAGALIGKIGDGRPFFIGDRFDAAPLEEGRLYLMIVPSPWNNQISGGYSVRVQTELSR